MASAKNPQDAVTPLPAEVREMIEDGPILVRAVIYKGRKYETKRPRPLPNGRSWFDFPPAR